MLSKTVQEDMAILQENAENQRKSFPLKEFLEECKSALQVISEKCNDNKQLESTRLEVHKQLDSIDFTNMDYEDIDEFLANFRASVSRKKRPSRASDVTKQVDAPTFHTGQGPYEPSHHLPGVWFFKLPHKNGEGNNVGNPLGKDFIAKVEDGSLTCGEGSAMTALHVTNSASYWKNARDRIRNQAALMLPEREMARTVRETRQNEPDAAPCGAILPRIVTAGTVTRRAVEPTWLTASNAYKDRVGSELKAMIQVR